MLAQRKLVVTGCPKNQPWAFPHSQEMGRGSLYTDTKHLYNLCTMLDQRRRRCADAVQMLYKCFVFVGLERA